ncbi:MAG: ATP-binding protein [Candidatus Hodarchaeales archaeon]
MKFTDDKNQTKFKMNSKERLNQKNEILKTVIDSLTHPFYIINIHDYSIALSNSAALKYLDSNHSSEPLTCYFLSHNRNTPCEGIDHPCPIKLVLKTKKQVTLEHTHIDANEKTSIFEIHGYPIMDRSGKIVQLIEYNLDITDRKKSQDLLKRQKEELSEFADTLSHDLRNRLMSIEGYAKILQSEYNSPYLDNIISLAQNINKLLEHSITLAKAGLIIDQKQPLDLNQLIKNIVTDVIPENIAVKVVDELPTVRGDREKLKQVFQNLFENAVKHGSPTKIKITNSKLAKKFILKISNDGIPIPTGIRKEIFNHGFTTIKDGRGLGLTIVQKIIEAHGWEIQLGKNRKTTFIITIPRL